MMGNSHDRAHSPGKPFFAVEMLPAGPGDALWIEYGYGTEVHRVLVDGGTPDTLDQLKARLAKATERHLELLVITHIDGDHIGGPLRLLSDVATKIQIDDVWFNGWKHLPGTKPDDRLGPGDAEFFTLLVRGRDLAWNKAFGGGPVMVGDDASQPLPVRPLPGGLKLTILSPLPAQLAALKPKWQRELKKMGLAGADWDEQALIDAMRKRGTAAPDILGSTEPDIEDDAASRFVGDHSPTNGASIAMLAEFEGMSCLLAADAYAPVVEAGLRRLRRERGAEPLTLSAVKVAHHGSGGNTSSPLVEAVQCSRFLISTDGSTSSRHPDQKAIARLIAGSPAPVRLYFNYKTDYTRVWADPSLPTPNRFEVIYPKITEDGFLRVEL